MTFCKALQVGGHVAESKTGIFDVAIQAVHLAKGKTIYIPEIRIQAHGAVGLDNDVLSYVPRPGVEIAMRNTEGILDQTVEQANRDSLFSVGYPFVEGVEIVPS